MTRHDATDSALLCLAVGFLSMPIIYVGGAIGSALTVIVGAAMAPIALIGAATLWIYSKFCKTKKPLRGFITR